MFLALVLGCSGTSEIPGSQWDDLTCADPGNMPHVDPACTGITVSGNVACAGCTFLGGTARLYRSGDPEWGIEPLGTCAEASVDADGGFSFPDVAPGPRYLLSFEGRVENGDGYQCDTNRAEEELEACSEDVDVSLTVIADYCADME